MVRKGVFPVAAGCMAAQAVGVGGDAVAEDEVAGVVANGRAFCPGGMSRRTEGYNGYT